MLVRILANDPFGAWTLFISIGSLLEVTRNGLFKNPLIRFLNTSKEEDLHKIQNSSVILNLAFSILSSLLLLFISFRLSRTWNIEGFERLFLWNVATNLFLPFFSHFEYLLKANFDFKASFIGYFTRHFSIFVFLIYFFISGSTLSLELLAIGYTTSIVLGTFINYLSARRYTLLSFVWDPPLAKKLLGYGKYTLGTNIATVLSRNIDAWMIAWYISPAAVAVYNIAIRISNLFEVPAMAMAAILFPKAARRSAEEGESVLKEMYEKSVAAILVISASSVVVVLLFSSLIVKLLAGPGYEGSVEVLNITVFFGLILPFGKQMGVLLDAIGKAKLNMFFVVLAAVLNTIVNALMIPYFGIVGAAIATLSVFFVTTLIGLQFLYRKYDVSLFQVLRYMRSFIIDLPRKTLKINHS